MSTEFAKKYVFLSIYKILCNILSIYKIYFHCKYTYVLHVIDLFLTKYIKSLALVKAAAQVIKRKIIISNIQS